MSIIWCLLIILILYLVYKKWIAPLRETFNKSKQMINDLSVNDRNIHIQEMLQKQLQVFESLKDDPESFTETKKKEKKKKKKNKKKKKKFKRKNRDDTPHEFQEKIEKLSDYYKKNKNQVDEILKKIPKMKELRDQIRF